MSDNIYGGILYPNSSFIIDKIYSNYKAACDNAATDGILIGRYVLIAYTERPLSYADRTLVIMNYSTNLATTQLTYSDNSDQQTYHNNLIEDEGIDHDRIICRKDYVTTTGKDGQKISNYTYTRIANLSTSIDYSNVDNNAFLKKLEDLVDQYTEGTKDVNKMIEECLTWQPFTNA